MEIHVSELWQLSIDRGGFGGDLHFGVGFFFVVFGALGFMARYVYARLTARLGVACVVLGWRCLDMLYTEMVLILFPLTSTPGHGSEPCKLFGGSNCLT